MLKFILLPVVLCGGLLAAMAAHIMGTSIQRQLSWTPVEIRVVEAAHLCAVTYQPQDAILRQTATVGECDEVGSITLPEGGTSPRILAGEYGRLAYEVSGHAMEWVGKLSDAGVYNATPGQVLPLLYDPDDPTKLDTAAMKGWLGGVLILFLGGGFTVFYLWYFWLRRR